MQSTEHRLAVNIEMQSTKLLNRLLEEVIDLHDRLRQAHWHVRGPGRTMIHELFGKVSGRLEAYPRMIAARVCTLGGTAGSTRIAAAQVVLMPYPRGIADEKQHILAILDTLSAFGRSAQAASDDAAEIGDADTSMLLIEICRGIDRQIWFVQSHAMTSPARWASRDDGVSS